MTKEQADAIIMVTASLCDKFDIPVNTDRIVYHHWYNLVTGERNNGTYLNKSCPGTNFFGGNKVENCNVNFIPKVKSAIKPKTSHHFSTEIKFYAQVTAGALNIRSGPGSSNPLISERDPARHGAILRVYEVKKNWYRISSSSQHWVSARYTADVKRAVVNASLLNVRNQPNPEGDVYTQLKKGEVVYVSQESNGWCRIALNDMWVSKEYLKF